MLPRTIVLVGSGELVAHLAEELRSSGAIVEPVLMSELKRLHREAHASRLTPLPFDRPSLDWSPVAVGLLQTLDRVFSRPLPASEIVAYADRLAHLCHKRLSRMEAPVTTLFTDGPHLPSHLLFAYVAEQLGHDVVTFEPTALRASTLRHALSPEAASFAAADSAEPSSGDVSPSETLRPSLLADQQLTNVPGSGSWSTRSLASWLWHVTVGLCLLPFPERIAARIRGHASPIQGHRVALFASLHSVVRTSRARRFLARSGLKDAHVTLAGRYAFLPLHYQPERTTAPDCGRYADQVQFLADVRAALDSAGHEDLLIVVKEHPAQLRQPARDRTFRFRDCGFYRRLLDVDRTVLAHPDSKTSDLIAASRIVVTPNGSAAWEALAAGIPVMTARRTWHSDCAASIILDRDRAAVDGLRNVLSMGSERVRDSVRAFRSSERLTIPGLPFDRELLDDGPAVARALADGFWARIPQLTRRNGRGR